jgi:8-oxo-dGTP diphosphatase
MGLTQATLCILNSEKMILLGMKKASLFGGGKYNGPGGKVKLDLGETPEQAAIRELREEAGLQAELQDLVKVGEFTFYFPEAQAKYNQTVHVYNVLRWQGELGNSEEMDWNWFSHQTIPYHQMWDGDRYWLPEVLQGKRLKGTFTFDENKKVIDKQLENL